MELNIEGYLFKLPEWTDKRIELTLLDAESVKKIHNVLGQITIPTMTPEPASKEEIFTDTDKLYEATRQKPLRYERSGRVGQPPYVVINIMTQKLQNHVGPGILAKKLVNCKDHKMRVRILAKKTPTGMNFYLKTMDLLV